MKKLDNWPHAFKLLQHEIRPKLPGAVISDTIKHHASNISLKISGFLNLSYESGNRYYCNIANIQKCDRKLSARGKKRSSKLLVLFQEPLRNHSGFLYTCHN